MTSGTLHLVSGDVAAGVLHEAMAAGVLSTAPVLRFRDIYCIGPLGALGTPTGAASRAAFWGQLMPDSPPALAEFEEEEARYAQVREQSGANRLVLWVGAHSSAQLWLQRLCAELPAGAPQVHVVDAVEPDDGGVARRTLGQFEPGEVGELLARLRPLDARQIAQRAQDWRANAAVASGLRRWREGRISHHDSDFYDELLLAVCDADWQPAQRVVGAAQWECDEFLGDIFFAWRLRCLAHAGRLAWRGPQERLAAAEVRLAPLPGRSGRKE